jgi:CP family cyanate transporter-like MFS transporter
LKAGGWLDLRRNAIHLGLIWLTAFNLRVVMFAIPPSLPAIQSSLGLSYSATGSITSLMVLTLGAASIPGTLLTGRVRSRRLVAVAGLALVAVTVSLTLPPSTFWVFFGSAALATAIAVAQPGMAVLTRRWFPGMVARASGLYGNGLLVGNIAGATLSPYLVRSLGWQNTFLVLAGIVLPGVMLWVWLSPRDTVTAPHVRILAMARDRRVWHIASLFTFQNLTYYTVATWMPFLLNGRSTGYIATALLFLNCIPTLPMIALSVLRWRYALSTPYYVAAGVLAALGSFGMVLKLVGVIWLLAFLVGLGASAAFIGALSLPALVAKDESEAAGFSAHMFAAGYVLAFAGPVAAGVLVDSTGKVTTAFWPAVVGGLLMAAAGSLAPRLLGRYQARHDETPGSRGDGAGQSPALPLAAAGEDVSPLPR